MTRTIKEIVEILQSPTPPGNISFVARKGSIQKLPNGSASAIALPHIDARFTQSRLDAACGPLSWQSGVREIAGILMVGIGIHNPETEDWIWKWDTGQEKLERDESGFGGKKGLVSQGFKRAGFQWGIGRDSYDYPIRRLSCKLNAKGQFYGWLKNPKADQRAVEEDAAPESSEATENGEDHIKSAEVTPPQARRSVYDYAIDEIGMIQKEANAWINLQESECEEKTVECYRAMYQLLLNKKKASKPPDDSEKKENDAPELL